MKKSNSNVISVTQINYQDEELTSIGLPNGEMKITRGLGSGLTQREGDPKNHFWAIGDRGPNFKVSFAIERLGIKEFEDLKIVEGVKIMPAPHIGPAISELKLDGDTINCLRTFAIKDINGESISGLPSAANPGETAVDLSGNQFESSATGVDSEGIAAMNDGTFWIADEYSPSLLHLHESGKIIVRLIPKGLGILFKGANYPINEILPEIAAKRQFNRGFEAIAISKDEKFLYLAFQSPLAHPNETAHMKARHIRIWKLKLKTGKVVAQFLYPLDSAESFVRDNAISEFKKSDIKISELVTIESDKLLVLERGSATSKFYKINLSKKFEIAEKHLQIDTRPTLEQLSIDGIDDTNIQILPKSLVFTTDDFPQIDSDLEGVIMLSPCTLLLVNDNDFGVEGKSTHFWKIALSKDI
ncbi:esterase-like activity of phytase family protein [Pseudaquidulcibacter saccharophilus]|uniref:esterase-like activity of phytase family protein n=1 Tax=Pseudaquidulcibacter saccharophilus TaxID=2831900 RepID=UPI001EFF0961|nr:esterase-like activity of phytase family protein [Pseudaquidulcibacter saccharophilus]